MFGVVEEVVFDGFAAVAEAEDEIFVAVVGVVFHDVPDEGRWPPMWTMGLGRSVPAWVVSPMALGVRARMRMPSPPQNKTTFILWVLFVSGEPFLYGKAEARLAISLPKAPQRNDKFLGSSLPVLYAKAGLSRFPAWG